MKNNLKGNYDNLDLETFKLFYKDIKEVNKKENGFIGKMKDLRTKGYELLKSENGIMTYGLRKA